MPIGITDDFWIWEIRIRAKDYFARDCSVNSARTVLETWRAARKL